MTLDQLKKARQDANITMLDMGKQLGISNVAYWKIEHGKTKLSLENALKIAKYLHSDIDSLFLPSELTNEEQSVKNRKRVNE
ncbi:helix-turn-helix transcriptional regulator [Lentilactobacillus buchneri]|uniref:helix-turn-helix transcriptional regulator n=1 Tax=Lentilactobacillus buchneri TaxID=1581 RepID=UPI0034E4DCBC